MQKTKFFLAIANTITQYFNYAIFGLSAVTLSSQLMPGDTKEQRLINFFASIILTVLARPLGSIIFGSIGDLFGRRNSIILAGLFSSIGAIIASQIPSFTDIGIFASILLICSRMIFLAGLAGEVDGIRLYIAESVSAKKQNLYNGLITLFSQSGALFAGILVNIENYDYIGWRLCFLSGGIVGFIFSISRLLLKESIEFEHNKEHPSKFYNVTFFQIVNGQFLLLLKILFVFGAIGTLYQFNIIFIPSYLQISEDINFRNYIPYLVLSYGLFAPIWGYLADKNGGLKIVFYASIIILINYIALYYNFKNNNSDYIIYNIIFITSISSAFSVPAHILLKKNINIGMRYRIFSLGHSLGSLIISTPTGYIAGNIIISHDISLSVIYPALIVLLGYISLKSICKEFI